MSSVPVPKDFEWAPLIPELIVSDLRNSLVFWCDMLGFGIVYDRPDERFAFLEKDGAQIMLEERNPGSRQWIEGALEQPFGRGINFQTRITDLPATLGRLGKAGWPLYMEVEEKWYRAGLIETGVRQCIVQDPDGYLIRLSMPLGERALEKCRQT
jgi:catechol 2,3-dioxygenase-like lactoylglutathione lyase family enzyme